MNLVFRLLAFIGLALSPVLGHAHDFPVHVECAAALVQPPFRETLMTRQEERLLTNPRNGLLRLMHSTWLDLSGVNVSQADGLRLSSQIIASKALGEDERHSFLVELEKIQPMRADLQRLGQVYLNPDSQRLVLQRFVQVWKSLVYGLDPVLAQRPLNAESISLTLRLLPERIQALKLAQQKLAAAASRKSDEPFRAKISDFTMKKEVQEFFSSGRKALTDENPLGLVFRYSKPGWALLRANEARKASPDQMISLIEASSGVRLSAAVQEKLQDISLHAQRVQAAALHFAPGSKLMGEVAQEQNLLLAESEGEEILILPLFQRASNTSLRASFDLQPETLTEWTLLPSQLENTAPETPISLQSEPPSTEPVARVESFQTETPQPEPAPADVEDEIPEYPADVRFAPELRIERYVKSPEDLTAFLENYYTFGLPTYDGTIQIPYFRDFREGVLLIEFKQEWSPSIRQHRIKVTGLFDLNEGQQKAFWRDLARYHGYQEQVFTFMGNHRAYIGRTSTREIYISGAVYLKMILKHGLNDQLIEEVLGRVRTAAGTNYGDFHARIPYNGHDYEVFFNVQNDRVSLKTIF